jgi:hypothetical protein
MVSLDSASGSVTTLSAISFFLLDANKGSTASGRAWT